MGKEPVLFLINSLRLGGAEKICVELANSFVSRDIPVHLMVLELREAVLLDILDSRVRVIDLKVNHARDSFFTIKNHLKGGNYKNVLVFTFQLSVVLVLIRKIFGIRYKIVSRSINNLSEKGKREKNWWHKYVGHSLIRSFYFDVDHIIAQSSGMERDLIQLRGERQTPITTIFNFISQKESINEDGNKKSGSAKILFVGKLKEQKNVKFLLDSMVKLSLMFRDFQFVIVGNGPLREQLENYSNELGIQSQVLFEGNQKNVSRYYSEADLLVLGSWYEGFPNVLLEGLASGVPVVSVNCASGPEDIVRDGINGFLVEGYDPELFAQKMQLALEKDWSQKAIRGSIQRFDRDELVGKYLKVINP